MIQLLAAATLFLAPAQTVDAVTFTPPDGFVYDAREGKDHAILTRAEKTNYCVISIYRGVPRNADLAAQFAIDWKDPLHATGPMPALTKRKAGADAVEAAGLANVGDQVVWADMIDIDAGANVVTITAIAPSEALFPPCRKSLDAFLGGLVVKKTAAAPVAAAAATAAPAVAPVSVPVTTADMVGEWTTGASSSVSYVDSYSGNYAGSSTVFYGERYTFKADGTYDYSFSGMSNGHIVREQAKGTWALGGTKITVTPAGEKPKGLDLLEFDKAAGKLTVLSDVYHRDPGAYLYKEVWQRAPKK